MARCTRAKNGIRVILINLNFRRSAIMESENVLKLKEKLIASSFLCEAQIKKHHTDSASP